MTVSRARLKVFLTNLLLTCFNIAGIWTGWTDEKEENILRDTNSNEILSTGDYAPFIVGEPNGLEAENCVSMNPDGQWMDFDCNQLSVAPCYIKRMPPQFKLRGNVLCNSFSLCTAKPSILSYLNIFRKASRSPF